jgi:CRISPR type III-A-associated protein Csm2
MAGPHGNNQFSGGGFHKQPETKAKALEVTFYIDKSNDVLDPELLDKKALAQAEKLHDKISSAQTRKFFGEIKNLYLRLEQGREWGNIEPLFRMIKSKAYYSSKSGGNAQIPDEFRAFITDNIDRVKDEKDFRAFVMYFEAVLGFAYGLGLVKK